LLCKRSKQFIALWNTSKIFGKCYPKRTFRSKYFSNLLPRKRPAGFGRGFLALLNSRVLVYFTHDKFIFLYSGC